MPSRSCLAFTTLAMLIASTAAKTCSSTVSESTIATIDNSTFFDTCAEADEDVTFNVTTLFDVLNFTSTDFALFCNSTLCLNPVHEMIHTIPSDCLINYQGSERNLHEEVTALHDKCHKVLGTPDDDGDDTTDSDDMASMSMSSGMDMKKSSSSDMSSSSDASTVHKTIFALAYVLFAISTNL